MKKIILIYLFLILTAFAAGKATATFPAIDGWDVKVSEVVYVPENLWDMINGGADFYVKSGFVDLHLAEYVNPEDITVYAEIYKFKSASNAFGIYAAERSPDYKFLDIGGQSYLGEGILNIYNGIFYIKLSCYAEGDGVGKALLMIADAIVKASGQDSPLPSLLSVFPEQDKVDHSEQFIAINFLGHDFLQNGFLVDYKDGYQLFAIDGTNTENAQNMLRAWLEASKQSSALADQSSLVIEDPNYKNIPIVVSEQFIVGIVNGDSSPAEKAGLDELLSNLENF